MMETTKYFNGMQKIYRNILDFIEKEDYENESSKSYLNFNFNSISKDEKREMIKEILLIISCISKYHYRSSLSESQIQKILLDYKDQIEQTFSNREIFNILKDNKQIILFLLKQKMITLDNSICNILTKYNDFFSIEINSFRGLQNQNDREFEKKREIGENDSFICEIIRKDLIVDFVKYVNQTNLNLESEIKHSIFETHQFLNEQKNVTLVDYAAYFGSIQIFKYLHINNVKLDEKIMKYAIHGKNTELISMIESELKNVDDYQIKKFVNEAIKCHHNEIADYFLDKLENHDEIKSYLHKRIIRYHNYQYLNGTENWSNYADLFIENNYVSIVKTILNNFEDDIDKTLQRYEEKGCKTFLSLAIENENIEIVKYLINDLNASTSYFATDFLYDSIEFCTNKTLLYLAVERENAEIVRILLENNCFSNSKEFYHDKDYYSEYFFIEEDAENANAYNNKIIFVHETKFALATAVENGDKDIVELLLNYEQIDVNSMNCISHSFSLHEDSIFNYYKEEKTALSIAVEKGDIEIVKILLRKSNIDVNKLLKKRFIDVNKYRSLDSDGHFIYKLDSCNKKDYTRRFTAVDIAKEKGDQKLYQLLLNL